MWCRIFISDLEVPARHRFCFLPAVKAWRCVIYVWVSILCTSDNSNLKILHRLNDLDETVLTPLTVDVALRCRRFISDHCLMTLSCRNSAMDICITISAYSSSFAAIGYTSFITVCFQNTTIEKRKHIRLKFTRASILCVYLLLSGVLGYFGLILWRSPRHYAANMSHHDIEVAAASCSLASWKITALFLRLVCH